MCLLMSLACWSKITGMASSAMVVSERSMVAMLGNLLFNLDLCL